MFADVVTLDSGPSSAIGEHVLAGKSLPIAYSSFFNQQSSNPGGSHTFQTMISRGFSRLKGCLVSFYNPPGTAGVPAGNGTTEVNGFWGWHLITDSLVPDRDQMDIFIQLGNRVMPEHHVTSLSEAFYRLRLAVGKYAGDNQMAITPREFRCNKFILAWDFETGALQAGGGLSFTGLSSRSGELLTIQAKNMSAAPGGAGPSSVYVTLHYDAILQLNLDSAVVLD